MNAKHTTSENYGILNINNTNYLIIKVLSGPHWWRADFDGVYQIERVYLKLSGLKLYTNILLLYSYILIYIYIYIYITIYMAVNDSEHEWFRIKIIII